MKKTVLMFLAAYSVILLDDRLVIDVTEQR